MGKVVLRWIIRIGVPLAILFAVYFVLSDVKPVGESIGEAIPNSTEEETNDAISKATAISEEEALSGEYVVFINNDNHKETTQQLQDMFLNTDVENIADNLSCLLVEKDEMAATFVNILINKLPTGQMKMSFEKAIMVLSKGDAMKFDIIVMSKEIADNYNAYTIGKNDNVTMVRVK